MSYILFKAKRINSEEYDGTWIEGIPIRNHIGLFMCFDENPHYCSQYGYMEIDNVARVDESTLCRHTGLTDKNGRKIFEGDIVAYMDTYSTDNGYAECDCIGEVLWCEEELCFCVTERLSAESWEVLGDCCVIGNIFDNPQLLCEAGQQANADVLLPAT